MLIGAAAVAVQSIQRKKNCSVHVSLFRFQIDDFQFHWNLKFTAKLKCGHAYFSKYYIEIISIKFEQMFTIYKWMPTKYTSQLNGM